MPATAPDLFVPPGMSFVSQRTVIQVLRRASTPETISDICRASGLSRPTVASAINALLEGGVITEEAPTGSTPRGGRPSRRYRLATHAFLVGAVVLHSDRIEVHITDLDATPRAQRSLDVPDNFRGVDDLPLLIEELLNEALAENTIRNTPLACLVVAVMGVVQNTRIITRSGIFHRWRGSLLHDFLTQRYQTTVIVENNANLAALAGAVNVPDTGTMICLLLGSHIECGLVLGGSIHRGAHGEAGELSKGNWDQLYRLLSTGPSLERRGQNVYSRAFAGDSDAVAFVQQASHMIGDGLAPVIEFIDPDRIAIGGEAAAAKSVLTRGIVDTLTRRLGWSPDILTIPLGSRVVATGAIIVGTRFARERFLSVNGTKTAPEPEPVS
ncbi:ROK family transcriptional regulator [Devriesea agamarum]|uniref:ROK family transcriptional regulator n=1 Tax=Devriesea agamarum TaxID=472569 RepID=UPI00071CABF5|nr:ROK family protein [Devriesea agamarum]